MKSTGSGISKRKPQKKQSQSTVSITPSARVSAKKHETKGIKRKFVEIVHNEERELSEEDLKEFDDLQHFGEFLNSLDPKALARKISKQSRHTGPLIHATQKNVVGDSTDGEQDMEEIGQHNISSRDEGINNVRRSIRRNDVHDRATNSDTDTDTDHDLKENNDSHNKSSQPNHTTRSQQRSHIPLEEEYRNRSFVKSSAAQESDRLPIKLGDGRVQPVFEVSLSQSKSDTKPVKMDEKHLVKVESVIDTSSVHSSAEQLLITQETLANVALAIIEDPEENIGQINRLREIQQKGTIDQKRFAILTLSSVFRDIIPGYRIRPLTETEKAEKVTKEIRRLRNFEQVLVEQYKCFVTSLTASSKTARKDISLDPESTVLKATAIIAACSLVGSVPHFNFRTELLNILVNQVCRKRIDAQFVKAYEALQLLFANDSEGEASIDAMRLLCKKMKDREYQVDPSTLELFLHLRLLTEMEARGSTDKVDRERVKKKDRQFRTKKLKKLIKDHKEVEKDLEEARATVDTEARERLQGDVLKLVFTTFFRILKDRVRNLMGAALEGLAKFAHLVNVDFFGDLLEVLKEVMTEDSNSALQLSTRETLLCIVTAFTLLSGQATTAETISLDLSVFLGKLYHILLPLALHPDVELSGKVNTLDSLINRSLTTSKVNVSTETEMLLRALDAIFFKHRSQGFDRLSAFVKRLFVTSLHVPEKSSIAILELNRRLAMRYSKVHALFSTEETAGDGQYNGFTDNFELSSPATTSTWEIALIRKHFSPKVQQSGIGIMDALLEGNNKS